MGISLRSLAAAATILMGANLCMAADQIDNPQYKSWAKYKAGTTITTKTTSDMGGNKTEMESTTTLLDITADKATVETKMSMVMMGNKMDMPASKMEVPAKIDKPAPSTAPATTGPAATVSAEDVDVAGTKVHCTVTVVTNTTNGMTTNSKVWTSDAVPGGMVKSETTMDGTMKGTTSTALTAITIK